MPWIGICGLAERGQACYYVRLLAWRLRDSSHGRLQGRQAHTDTDVPQNLDYDAFYRTTLVVYLTLFQMADRS